MLKPDITVAICTHDNAEVLDRALRQLARQRVTSGTWELLVIANRCSDRTSQLLRAWEASRAFSSMRAVCEERLGLSNARRAAIHHARADLIAFIDDDCFLDTGWIDAAVRFGRGEPRAGAFGGRVSIRWETPPTDLGAACEWILARQELGPEPVKLPPVGGVPLVGAGIVIRRAAIAHSGWIERGHFMGRVGKALTSGDDAEMSFRIRSAGWDLWYTPTMKLDHVLGAWRSELRYLARLHYAVRLTLPHIWILAGTCRRTPFSSLFLLAKGLARGLRRALSALTYRVRGNELKAQQRWLDARLHFGCARGAFALPPAAPEPAQPASSDRLPEREASPRAARSEPLSRATFLIRGR